MGIVQFDTEPFCQQFQFVRCHFRITGKCELAQVYRVYIMRLEVPPKVSDSGKNLGKFLQFASIGHKLLKETAVKNNVLPDKKRLCGL